MRQELDVWGLIYVDGWSTCIESPSCGWRGLNSLFMLFVYKRSHTHTQQSCHMPTFTTLTLPQQVLGKYFQSTLVQGRRGCTMRFCLGRSHLGQKA